MANGRDAIPFLSSKISEIRSSIPKSKRAALVEEDKKEEKQIFLSIQREVEELGAQKLKGRELKAYKQGKLTTLLGSSSAKKKEKVPIKILKGMKEKQKKREQRSKEAVLELGLAARKSLTNNKIEEEKKRKRESKRKDEELRRKELPTPLGVGRFSNGTLFLSKRDIHQAKSSSKRSNSAASNSSSSRSIKRLKF
eukprot:TRINITY_DN7244_c0_g1_i1.p1 TRINITY_DN7244_c0_g1~~TRINITY_DN7244_c0_g1_i1.p1  ORF type:complete len:196 (+),score=84.15 TRINITY_DN7244_c0_g1_i1:40-627(+)